MVWVRLVGDDNSQTDFLQLGAENFYIKPGYTYNYLVSSPTPVKNVRSLELKWKHDSAWYEMNQWHIRKTSITPESIKVFSGEYQTESKFCDNKGELKSKSSRYYTNTC